MKALKRLLGLNKRESNFSKFFRESSSYEKKKVIKKAVRQANEEQKELVETYKKKYAN